MKQETTIEKGIRVDWDQPITMDDGIVLRADVFRPDDDGQYPVILSMGPYGKGLSYLLARPAPFNKMIEYDPASFQDSSNELQNWEVLDPETWVAWGYILVRVDSRGAGSSPGYLSPWSHREAVDYYHCVEWASAQPWSTGKVGISGISYYAINAWAAATQQPPHLAAICVWEGAADMYRDVYRHGGILSDFCGGRPYPEYTMDFYEESLLSVQYGKGERGPRNSWRPWDTVAGPTLSEEELRHNRIDWGAKLLEHKVDGPYSKLASADFDKVTTPFLSAGNWGGQGLHGRGNFEGFMRAASKDKWLEVHGHDHFTHYYTHYGQNMQRKFFDYFLRGEDNGWNETPRVQLQIRYPGEKFVDRAENEWPLARTQWTRFHLDADAKALNREGPVAAQSARTYQALGDGLVFQTPPLAEETEITGPVAAKLFVSSSTVDADLFLVLSIIGEDGEEIVFQGSLDANAPVGQGWLRMSHRKLDPALSLEYRPYHSHDEEQPLEPGKIYEVDVEIWPTCIVVPKGARVALRVRGKDYEYQGSRPWVEGAGRVWPSNGSGPFTHVNATDRPAEIFGGDVTVHTGGSWGSYLLLPIIPPSN